MKDKSFLAVILLAIMCVSLACGVCYYQVELEITELKLTKSKLESDRIIKIKSEIIEKREEALKNVLISQIHEYTMIDDRYLIRASIYNMRTIKGPMYVYDIGNRTHTVYYVNKHSNLRQPVFNELLYKFE